MLTHQRCHQYAEDCFSSETAQLQPQLHREKHHHLWQDSRTIPTVLSTPEVQDDASTAFAKYFAFGPPIGLLGARSRCGTETDPNLRYARRFPQPTTVAQQHAQSVLNDKSSLPALPT